MKIRLIFKGCKQTGMDSWADVFHTVDVEVPEDAVAELTRLDKAATLAGAELREDEK